MPRQIPALKPRQLVRLLEAAGCRFYREGKGDHRLYMREVAGRKVVVPIDMGAGNCPRCTDSPAVPVQRCGDRANVSMKLLPAESTAPALHHDFELAYNRKVF